MKYYAVIRDTDAPESEGDPFSQFTAYSFKTRPEARAFTKGVALVNETACWPVGVFHRRREAQAITAAVSKEIKDGRPLPVKKVSEV